MSRPATRTVRLIAVALAGALLAGCAAASGGAVDPTGVVVAP